MGIETPAETRQSFGEQAARFSLYAPFVVLGLGICTLENQKYSGVGIVVAVTNLVLITLGFVLGVSALVSMKWFGRRRILWRAVVGVALNGVLLLAVLAAFGPWIARSRVAKQLVGHWRLVSAQGATKGQLEMTLNADQTCRVNGKAGNGGPLDVTGHWTLSVRRELGIRIEHVTVGNPGSIGKDIGLGKVRSVDDRQVVLEAGDGDEVYERVR